MTPTKNRLPLLVQTMDSVAAQTFSAWEHVIVDDGSDDGTEQEVRRRARLDPRVRYLARTGEKTGASVCRNLGWRSAAADLIVFLDSDDLLDRDSLERRALIMGRNQDLDFITFQTGVFEEDLGDLGRQFNSEMLGDDLLSFLYFETPWQTTAPTWRRDALERLDGFDEDLPSWQDIDLHVRALAGGLRYLRFPDVDHHMRWQHDPTKVTAQQRRSPRHLKAVEGLLAKFERVVREGPGMNWVRQRALCSLYYFVGELWADTGDTRAALGVWKTIRTRSIGSWFLHASGAPMLLLKAQGVPCDRLINKWKGWMRLRTNAELVPPR